MRMMLRLYATALLRLGTAEIERSRQCERWADEALDRAQARFTIARRLAERLERARA